MIKVLHSKKSWVEIATIKGNKPITAVVSYANKDHLKLRAGDTLICDASESRITTGATTHALLDLLNKRKVNLWHFKKLHAKAIRLSEHVVVGSANMTSNSESLFEVTILTDQASVISQIDDMIHDLHNSGMLKKIDQKFLDRIKDIPVNTKTGRPRNAEHITNRPPASWIVPSIQLSKREQNKSDQIIASIISSEKPQSFLRITLGISKKPSHIQRGDSLIFVDKDSMRAERPVTVTGVFEHENYLFYIHEKITKGQISWKRIQEMLAKNGIHKRSTIPKNLPLQPEITEKIIRMFRKQNQIPELRR